jgi:ADP-heptose:LPS heptosyltransferase
MWTAVLRTVTEETGKSALVTHMPGLTDLARGRLYRGDVSLSDDPIFRHNPRLAFNETRAKTAAERRIDRLFFAALRRDGLKTAYEGFLLRATARHSRTKRYVLVNLDNPRYSYAASVLDDRMIWKTGGHAADIMARPFGVVVRDRGGEMHFDDEERQAARHRLAERGMTPGRYVTIDPETKTEYFGDLRGWPFERWQALVDRLRQRFADVPVVQLGLDRSRRLNGVVDLCGQTSVREVALVIAEAGLFMGTESGLMHVARAMNTEALILWGGVTLPEFAGYADRHTIICKRVECAPCGLLGRCPNAHKCMDTITVEEAAVAAEAVVEQLANRPRRAAGDGDRGQ